MARNISTGTMGVAVLAIFAGLICAYVVRAALRPSPTPQQSSYTATIPLAAVDLPADRIVALSDIRMVSLTSELSDDLAQRGIPLQSLIPAPEFIIGRRLKAPLNRNDPFQTTNLYLDGTGPDLTERIKPGFRAFQLSITSLRGGWVTAGTRVDVLFRSERQRSEGSNLSIPESTVTLLEDVEVLAVERDEVRRLAIMSPANTARAGNNNNNQVSNFEQSAVVPRSDQTTVTLALTPEQSVILQTVENRGELSLVARTPSESIRATTGSRKAITLEDILGIAPPTSPEPPFETEVFRRAVRQVNSFDGDRLNAQLLAPTPSQPVMPRVESSVTPDVENRTRDAKLSST